MHSRTSSEPGGVGPDGRTRPAERCGRPAPRHDADRRREPTDLGRHLPGQPRRVAGGARRAPPPRRASSSRPSRPATPASSRAGSARPAAIADECSTRPTRTQVHSIVCACTSRIALVLAGIFQALGAERINVSDFELEHLSPERGGTLTVLVTGEDDAAQAVSLLESQGYGVVLAPVLGWPNRERATLFGRFRMRGPGLASDDGCRPPDQPAPVRDRLGRSRDRAGQGAGSGGTVVSADAGDSLFCTRTCPPCRSIRSRRDGCRASARPLGSRPTSGSGRGTAG